MPRFLREERNSIKLNTTKLVSMILTHLQGYMIV